MKCRAIDKLIANTRYGFFQSGSVRRDSLDDSAFIAFSISITTRLTPFGQYPLLSCRCAMLLTLIATLSRPPWRSRWRTFRSQFQGIAMSIGESDTGPHMSAVPSCESLLFDHFLTNCQKVILGPSGLNMNHHAYPNTVAAPT